ncbi:hypothetical protein NM688_g2643 [Phlebia brevispora]|uniref:Uncharacterized protein n=1 Tax=Phlebia brevispora TaxID=194682 RepID=A0ACC1T7X9_9APHY|nr:hypothetical protein NM688_g2643 [Phlebia brevispora]
MQRLVCMILRSALHDVGKVILKPSSVRNCTKACRTLSRAITVLAYSTSAIGNASGRKPQTSVFGSSNAPTGVKLRLQDAKFDSLMWKLQTGLSEGSLERIRQSYTEFIENERQMKPALYRPRQRQQEVMLATIESLADAGDLDMLDIVLDLMGARCNMTISRELHQSIITRFLEGGRLHHVFVWLTQMRHKPGHATPSVEMWNSFIKKCLRNSAPAEFLRKPVACVRMSGCEPNRETYQAILEMFYSDQAFSPPIEDIRSVLEDMKKAGLLNSTTIDGLDGAYVRANVYEAAFRSGDPLQEVDESRVPSDSRINAMLGQSLLDKSERETTRLLRGFIHEGFRPDVSTLAVMAQAIDTLHTLVYWEGLLHVRADTEVWETVLQNAAQNNSNVAMEIYHAALARGHIPTVPMLLPILRDLCFAKWKPPPTKNVDKALQLLAQYVDLNAEAAKSTRRQPSHRRSGDDLPLYNVVLRALVSAPNIVERLPTATALLEEIQSRGIPMNSSTCASFIILSMQCASSPEEAIKVYRMMTRAKPGRPSLDAKGYTAVLGAFTKNFLRNPAAFQSCLGILKDMRQAGYPMTVEVFSIILSQLGVLASEVPKERIDIHQQILASIRRIHNHISVEAGFKPDTVLWNQLMNTYQRAGSFRDAYKVWEAMFITREFDYASVSIIADACAYFGAYDTAMDVFLKLQRVGFVFNDRNWLNWIECLCRLGRIEDATKVVCLQMPMEKQIKPGLEHARLLLQFAAKRNEESLVIDRLRRYLPHLYQRLQ